MSEPARAAPRVPGEALLGVLPISAAALIAVNDLVLKPHSPGWLSGKLSDVGICLLLPLVLHAGSEWLAWIGARAGGRSWTPGGPRTAMLACIVAATYYTAHELWPAFAALHARAIELLLRTRPVPATTDAGDLACLALMALSYRRMVRLDRAAPRGLAEEKN